MLTSLAATLSSHPRRTLVSVLVFVVVAGAVGGPLAGSLRATGGFAPPNSESQRATRLLEAATGAEPTPAIDVLVATPSGPGAAAPRIAAVARRLRAVAGVLTVTAPAAIARDGRLALITGTLRAGADVTTAAKHALSAFAGDRGVTVGGSAVAGEQIGSAVTKDLGFAELIVAPLLIGLSLLFFRGRAALMPLAAGAVTVLGAFLVLTGVNHLYGLSVFALNLVIGLGLGLSVDYTLFIVTRYREELAAGADPRAAIGLTLARAGRSVLFSAATVACALITLMLFPQGFLKSMGIAGAITAVIAALSALTVSPALLGLWGAALARPDARAGQGDRWYRFARLVMRRPGLVAAVTRR